MFKELSDSLRLSLLERATSPALGAFITFWLIFNWEAIAYFFYSEDEIVFKLVYLDIVFNNPEYTFWKPFEYTIWFIPLYALFSLLAFSIWEGAAFGKNWVKDKLDGKTRLSFEQSNQIRLEMAEAAEKHEKARAEIANELERHKDIVRKVEIDKADLRTQQEKTLSGLRQELAQKNNQISDSNDELTYQKQKLEETTDKYTGLSHQINSMRTELELANEKLQEQKQLNETSESKMENLKRERDEAFSKFIEIYGLLLDDKTFKLHSKKSDKASSPSVEFGNDSYIKEVAKEFMKKYPEYFSNITDVSASDNIKDSPKD